MRIELETEGIKEFERFLRIAPDIADHAAQLAVNDTARFALRTSSKQMREEVRFTLGYLTGGDNGRLSISRFATRDNHSATIRGRDRPTSLARFATTPVRYGRQKGIRVKVNPGSTKLMKRAFYMRLKRGRNFDAENANTGLAVRLGPGERLTESRAALELGNGLWLLYGPSVEQVFQGVATDVLDEVSDKLTDEFLRQFERLSA